MCVAKIVNAVRCSQLHPEPLEDEIFLDPAGDKLIICVATKRFITICFPLRITKSICDLSSQQS